MNSPGAGLDEMIDIVVPIISKIDGDLKMVTKSEIKTFD
jgi:hypothetical protein